MDANEFGRVDGLMLTESYPSRRPLLHLSCTSYGPLILLFRCIHTVSCSPWFAISPAPSLLLAGTFSLSLSRSPSLPLSLSPRHSYRHSCTRPTFH